MRIHPMISALRRHKSGVVLIGLQIALTLAIVCNAIFIIGQRVERVNRPSGMDEKNLFQVSQQWVGAPSGDDAASVEKLDNLQLTDLAALRALPDVASVTPVNTLPMTGRGSNGQVSPSPGARPDLDRNVRTTYYYGDEQLLATLGLRLVAGRDFNAGDVRHKSGSDSGSPAVVIVTQALADKLFPKGDALGKTVYLNGTSTPSVIIGVVAKMMVSSVGSWSSKFTWLSTLIPARLDASISSYAIRAKPGRLNAAMRAVPPALYKINPLRVLDEDSVKSFDDIRTDAYRADVGMAVLIGVVCLVLLAVTAAGIVGLTTFWVGQRRRQIGVRRALGARKVDILNYFQLENLAISGAGAVLGMALAVGLNLLLMRSFEMDRLPVLYVLAGIVVVLALGQGAVFVPARRASNVPPVEATRSV